MGVRVRHGVGTSRETSPEEELDKNVGLYTAGQVSEGAGRANCFSLCFFPFLQKCEDKREGLGNMGGQDGETGWWQARVAGSRGKEDEGEAAVEGVVAYLLALRKAVEINCHSFVSELYSFRKDT